MNQNSSGTETDFLVIQNFVELTKIMSIHLLVKIRENTHYTVRKSTIKR